LEWILKGVKLPRFACTLKENHVKDMKQVVALAVAGLTAGVSACGGNSPAAEAPAAEPAAEPAGEKHSCKTDAEGKHICGAEMKKSEDSGTAPAPANVPAEETKPAP
jgi:hypothetical protein